MEPQTSGEAGGGTVLPHHEQQPLCTTRLPYRQGRKLTAVKVYTINNESNHLLVFGVPSLKLQQETKALFSKFGKLVQCSLSTEHPAELFTETYHVVYEKIQHARKAKRMLDTRNFYGGSLHICYAPEFESVVETRNKLLQRQKDVLLRLRKIDIPELVKIVEKPEEITKDRLYMGEVNIINEKNEVVSSRKRPLNDGAVIEKKFKPCFVPDVRDMPRNINKTDLKDSNKVNNNSNKDVKDSDIEIIDFTSTEKESITNINEALNYNQFGNEIIRKVPAKPLNRIKFTIGNKS